MPKILPWPSWEDWHFPCGNTSALPRTSTFWLVSRPTIYQRSFKSCSGLESTQNTIPSYWTWGPLVSSSCCTSLPRPSWTFNRILHKLMACRIIDRADVLALLRANHKTLDTDYINKWVRRLALQADWATVWAEAFPGTPCPGV